MYMQDRVKDPQTDPETCTPRQINTDTHGYRHTEPLTQRKTNTNTCRHTEKHICTDLHT
jgi:hypothetical protein